MKTNDLKKGTEIRLASGLRAELLDNKKGNIRMARVYGAEAGWFDETGSIYTHDIVKYRDETGWHYVDHTEKQRKHKQLVESMFEVGKII